MPEISGIIFYGRSGDELLKTVESLAQYLIKQGFYVMVYPEYDPERRETIAKVHMRILDSKAHGRGPIKEPDVVVVTDHRLLDTHADEVMSARKYVIINAPSRDIAMKVSGAGKRVIYVNTSRYGRVGRNDVVTAMLGAVLRVMGIEDMDWLRSNSTLAKLTYNDAEIL
ncbi:2-oxoacid:acceptor oxidoreductase family protein [Vulcanisaeta thermophila]|uniref:2-oxoacid:acceptor oxidoreductase family protein n=1 Tax=Vulcanisaeta thermophila TaxID=867917 RepID=UPI000A028DDE|nr:2-oxoacid:acceptor oxidoreductase family protein [Vulcanisaeta thermophila]